MASNVQQIGDIAFSIVIPLYNKEKYIRKTVESVLLQTYPFFEVIVVDDGSTDGGGEMIKTVSDERVRLIRQENSGVSVARNRGIEEAREKYVAFLDADDYWHPMFLQRMAEMITCYPDAGLYASRYAEVVKGKLYPFDLRLSSGFTHGYISYFELYAKTFLSPVWTSAVVIPKEVFACTGGFSPGMKAGEDIMLWIKIALKEPVVYLNEMLAYYNNDVPQGERLSKKLYGPGEHYIFSVNELKDAQNKLEVYLIDGLILRTLRPYYALGLYPKETRRLIHEVDFHLQPLAYKIYYHLPVWCVKFVYMFFKRIRSLLS